MNLNNGAITYIDFDLNQAFGLQVDRFFLLWPNVILEEVSE